MDVIVISVGCLLASILALLMLYILTLAILEVIIQIGLMVLGLTTESMRSPMLMSLTRTQKTSNGYSSFGSEMEMGREFYSRANRPQLSGNGQSEKKVNLREWLIRKKE